MKKILGLLFLLIALSLVAYILVKKGDKDKMELATADRGFTVKSMNEIDKIVIKHVKLQPMVFTKKGKGWILDGKYDVDPAVFVNIEKVLLNMTLSYIPPKSATKNIMNGIKDNGIQVDLYHGNDDKPFKIFHVGADTQNAEGTYMILGGSTQPYVMGLPGLIGGLRSRFEQPAKNYRDKVLYKFNPKDIASIKLEYPKDNFSSFEVINGANPTVTPMLDLPNHPKTEPNKATLIQYIGQFENMGTEGIVDKFPERDSMLNELPNAILTIVEKDHTENVYKFYNFEHIMLNEENPITQKEIFNANRFYIYDENDDTVYSGQMRVIRGIFHKYMDFYGTSYIRN